MSVPFSIACAAFLVQPGFRNTMPELVGEVKQRDDLVEHCRRVYEISKHELPAWLRTG